MRTSLFICDTVENLGDILRDNGRRAAGLTRTERRKSANIKRKESFLPAVFSHIGFQASSHPPLLVTNSRITPPLQIFRLSIQNMPNGVANLLSLTISVSISSTVAVDACCQRICVLDSLQCTTKAHTLPRLVRRNEILFEKLSSEDETGKRGHAQLDRGGSLSMFAWREIKGLDPRLLAYSFANKRAKETRTKKVASKGVLHIASKR